MVGRQNKSTFVQCFIVVSKGFGNLVGKKKIKSKASGYPEPGRTFHQRNRKAQRPKGRSVCGGSRSSQVPAVVGAQ